MKNIANSKLKNSFSLNLKNSISIPFNKKIRSTAGIREIQNGSSAMKIEIEDVIGTRYGKVGSVEMNKEHKSNVLSESFMTDIRRSLEAIEIDEDMKAVVLKSKKSEIFSMGTDLNYLYYKKKSGEIDKINLYFQNLYNFHNFIASYHKPLLTLGNGILKGSGVSLLSSSNFPMSTLQTQASFPEVRYGYVPDSGSIFLLSRLSGEMGVFLALTGYKLVNWDLVALGLARDLTHTDPELALSRQLFGKNHNDSLNEWMDKWPEIYNNYQKEKYKSNNEFLNSEDSRKLDNLSLSDNNMNAWEKIENPKLYSTQLHKIVTKSLQKNEFNFKDYKGRIFTNTHENFSNEVYPHLPKIPLSYFSLAHVVDDINRLFRFNSVQDIIEALKNENTSFSQWCLDAIEMKSPLALEVTLRMIREAKTLNYSEIICQEINVAKNMILYNKDFDKFMENKLIHSKNRVRYGSMNSVRKEDIELIFKNSKILSEIKLDLKENSLLPNRFYNKNYPDCFTLWINENPRVNEVIRSYFDYEIKNFLIEKL